MALYQGFTTIRLMKGTTTAAIFGGAGIISGVLVPRAVEATLDTGPRTDQGEITILTISFTTANTLEAGSHFNV